MTRTGLSSGGLTAERVVAVVTLTSPLSVLRANTSFLFYGLRQLWLLISSQAPADRSFNGHLAWALDAEPQG